MKQNSQKQTQSIGRRIKIACFHISYVSLILGGTHVEKKHVKNIYKITSQLLAMEVGTRQPMAASVTPEGRFVLRFCV
jgi:hypothetical protein